VSPCIPNALLRPSIFTKAIPDPDDPSKIVGAAEYGYLWWLFTGASYLGNAAIGSFQCALGAFGHVICICPELNRVLVQQQDDVEPLGNLVPTVLVAFDPSVSFDATSTADVLTNGDSSGGESSFLIA